MLSLKQKILLRVKNIPGWRTNRKIVVFSVDDYGNIRIASKEARLRLISRGLNLSANRFDHYDALEDSNDLDALFGALSSVKDLNGNHAVFTAFAVPATIDFDRMASEGYERFQYVLLNDVLERTLGYDGTWKHWQEGIKNRFIIPQFHGREHVNLKFLNHFLQQKNKMVLACLEERCWAGLDFSPFPNLDYVSSFSFEQHSEMESLNSIAIDGLAKFENVFGYSARNFNSPGASAYSDLEKVLAANGIRYIDTPPLKREHKGNGKYIKRYGYVGQSNSFNQTYLIRNCVFEPSLTNGVDSVERALYEVAVAFQFSKPAVISSHRVNFCGHIDEKNRAMGITALHSLLHKIVERWPDVEFMTANELGDLIASENKSNS
ncbi:MAG: hypothetical protein ORN54_08835 [Cyclobacteriaceae bacterium]|nr:hypothetical protein [Cyclobacteriaceae bacterium]